MCVLKISASELKSFNNKDISADGITPAQKDALVSLVNNYRDYFAQSLNEVGCAKSTEININLAKHEPVTYRPYRMPVSEREKVKIMIEELLENNTIRESNSDYSAPILLVKKKSSEARLCIDYRKLNNVIIKDRYPLPRIDDQLDRLRGCHYCTSLDLMSGYYQIPVADDSKHLTSFVTPDGQYEFNRLPFGLTTAPSVFQCMMDKVLGPLKNNVALAYIDDILIPTKTIAEGMKNLEII